MTQITGKRLCLSAPALADQLAESVRQLNHALQGMARRGEWPMPPEDAYRIVSALRQAAGRLPVVLHEMGGFTTEPEGLRVDDGTAPEPHLDRLFTALHDAQQHARALEAALADAHRVLGTVSYPDPWDAP